MKNAKMNNDFSSVLIKKSLLDVEDSNTFSVEAKRKKSKKRAREQFNSTTQEIFDDSIKKKRKRQDTDESDVLDNEFIREIKIDAEAEAYLKKINCAGSPSAEYSRSVSKILSDFENKNESLKEVCCENSFINSLNSNSSVFIVQIPINLNPIELVGKEISFLKKKKIKTDKEKYIWTSSHVVEPVLLTTNNSRCIRLHPSCVVTLERDCKIEESETFNVPNFANNSGVNVIDPAYLTRKNPIIGLEKEECERVLSSSVESKLKAAVKMYKKYKNKKIKKSSTQDGIKRENIKDEEIFKYLSQPSLGI